MEYKEIFKARLRALRKERHARQQDVADDIGITMRHYQRIELGEGLPGFEVLIALADYFGVSLDYLTGRTDRR